MPATPFATSVVKKLVQAGHIAYFAGGWVRDYLMNLEAAVREGKVMHPSDDIDIATSASVTQIQSLFPKTIPVGVAFGIVIVVEEGHHFEVATFRKESGYLDGRRPTAIEPASAIEDAKRRDFTINGMFWDPIKEELHDYIDGQKDLENKLVRAIGNPHLRFLEDRLRMMRAVRYSTRFNFPIEEQTLRAIVDHSSALFPSVAIERVWQEFKKMSQFAHFDEGLILLHQLNLLQTIFPQLKEVSTEEIQRRLKPLAFYPKAAPTIAELMELFPDYALNELLELCDYLKLSRSEKEVVQFLHQAKQLLEMPLEWQAKLENIEWVQFYANPYSKIAIEIHAALLSKEKKEPYFHFHAEKQHQLSPFILRKQTQNPVVRADHLKEVGIAPGKKMGLLLKEAEKMSANQEIENPRAIIELLKNCPLWNT